ncbi:alpha-tocopherol transfer protein-like [Saccoglossus kowalevskii]|uniref:Alpha-tocopherol transfer protein-like n=1 Tax=Saccoglossus kowalevskii TaxID=10224 RepID=A0ABM0MCM1_SACKO|nr:PREDICTED: alpha-tocopherol transfer protein-like [Saccoglossus kowalevskii]
MAAQVPTYECTLSPELQEKARLELNESPETRDAGLKTLFDMITSRDDIRCPIDAVFLLCFLRARKFNIKRTFKLLERWCKMRSELVEIFGNYKPSSVMGLIESGVFVILPSADPEGRPVAIDRPGKWDVTKYTAWDFVKVEMMMCDLQLWNEETQINGFVDIFDMEGFGLHHMTQFGPRFVIKTTPLMNEDTLPLRIKGIHVVKESGLFDGLYKLFKPFLKDKIKKRLRVHGKDITNLHSVLPTSILPPEYGGSYSAGIDDIVRDWAQQLGDKEEFFISMERYGLKKTKKNKKGAAGGACS